MDLLIKVTKDVSSLGNSPAIFVIAFLVTLYFIKRKDYLRVFTTILSYLSGVYSTVLKAVFMEQRPYTYVPSGINWDRILVIEDYSFPSTHTVFYTVFFGYLLFISFRIKGVNSILKFVVRILSSIFIGLVGASRVLLGAHFVRDVIAGYVFGFIYLMAVIKLEIFLEQRQLNKQLEHKKL